MASEHQQIEVRHVPERCQFEARLKDDLAVLTYTTNGNEISLDHTYVPDARRGRGVAGELVRAAVNEARLRHWKLRARGSYVVTFFERHPEFADVVASF
jgi:predicted GNAT family acetyltransferase